MNPPELQAWVQGRRELVQDPGELRGGRWFRTRESYGVHVGSGPGRVTGWTLVQDPAERLSVTLCLVGVFVYLWS